MDQYVNIKLTLPLFSLSLLLHHLRVTNPFLFRANFVPIFIPPHRRPYKCCHHPAMTRRTTLYHRPPMVRRMEVKRGGGKVAEMGVMVVFRVSSLNVVEMSSGCVVVWWLLCVCVYVIEEERVTPFSRPNFKPCF